MCVCVCAYVCVRAYWVGGYNCATFERYLTLHHKEKIIRMSFQSFIFETVLLSP